MGIHTPTIIIKNNKNIHNKINIMHTEINIIQIISNIFHTKINTITKVQNPQMIS